MNHFVYILRCADGTLYSGYTIDLDNRLLIHNKGRGAKYTRTRLPVEIVYYKKYSEKSPALKREFYIKQLKRKDKLRLIREFKKRN